MWYAFFMNQKFESAPEKKDAQEHAKEIERLRENFNNFHDPAFSSKLINDFAEEIRAKVQSGEVSWNELEFTEKELEERIRLAELDRDEETGEHFSYKDK